MNKEFITLSDGSGGQEMQDLIESFNFKFRGEWKQVDKDSSTIDIGNDNLLVFTTDSFVVDPIFFPGGDIGHLAFCGTVNDLCVMGAKPLGLSLGIILEEGFPRDDLEKILNSIRQLSEKTGIPIATGDTKVMEKGKLDKIIINTSGIGIVKKTELLNKQIIPGDKIIISGGIGEHAAALLSKRFDYSSDIITDSKPLNQELFEIRNLVKQAKDPTRGGIASVLNEICTQNECGMLLAEEKIPVKDQVKTISTMLGLNTYELASEGRFVCISSNENAENVERSLRKFNPDAAIIGTITEGNKVILETGLGKRILPTPTGRIVPRIC